MFLSFAIAILIYYLIELKNYKLIFVSVKYYILILLFFAMILLLSSKAGILITLLIFLLSLIYLFFYKKYYLLSVIFLLCISLMSFVFLKAFPYSLKRVELLKSAILDKKYTDKENNEGNSSRILVWKTSLELIKENPVIGVGTGDAKDKLIEKYQENNISNALNLKLNSHNQYLQTWIATGILGFLILILCFLLSLIKSFKEKNYLYLIFLIVIILNISVESMFERQAGVVFYAFFNVLLFYKNHLPENSV